MAGRAGVGQLADYVLEEAERRDPDLAANARQRLAMVRAADERIPFDPADIGVHFTPEEDAEYDRLAVAYNKRLAFLAAPALAGQRSTPDPDHKGEQDR